jgi:NodT family efflux transporter outer membrane factor (OMF) lipoprotein
VSIFCSSCAITQKYQRPAMPAPVQFKGIEGADQWKTAVPGDGVMKGKWWEIYGDATLNGLVDQISVSNYNVKQLEAEFRESVALIAVSRSGYYPTVTTGPAISQGDRGPNAGGQSGHGTSSSFSIPFSASWVPDLWNRVGLTIENANATAQVSAANLENLRLSLQATLAVDYFELRGDDEQLDLLNTTISIYQQYLDLTNNRFNGGVAALSDVYLAQTQLYQTQAQATDLGVTRNQFEHAIAVLTGQAPAGFSIASRFPSAPPPPPANAGAPTLQTPPVVDYSKLAPPPIPVGVPSSLLERRPDIAGQERSVAAANASIGLARTAWYPELTLGASAGVTSGSLLNLLTWGSRVWSAGPTLAQTIFDAGKRRAQLRQSIAVYDATAAAYRQTVLSAFQQVEDNLSTLRVLAQEAQQQALAVDASVKSLNLEIERYRAGTDSYLNVITTQQIELNNARTAVSLHQERMTTSVNLILALGGGWDQSALPTPGQLRSGGLEDPAKTMNVAQPVAK